MLLPRMVDETVDDCRSSVPRVHFFHQSAHGLDENYDFSPLCNGLCRIEAMFSSIGVTDRSAGRCSPVHATTAVRHRGRPT